MQNHLINLIAPQLVVTELTAQNDEEIIRSLVGLLTLDGRAGDEFADAAITRERVFPTGLPTQPVGVAIPHADPDGVTKSGVCVGVLATPVQFGLMGTDGSTKVDVQIVFLLAILEREKQTSMIQELIALIQSSGLLKSLSSASTPDQVYNLIRTSISTREE